jgi:hypothetical protein
VLRTRKNEIIFGADDSRLVINKRGELRITRRRTFELKGKEGLYEMTMSPLYLDDIRMGILPCVDLTLDDDPRLWNVDEKKNEVSDKKAHTKLGVWYCKVLWMSVKMGLEMPTVREGYANHLNEFCYSYIVPPSQPTAKRTYRPGET